MAAGPRSALNTPVTTLILLLALASTEDALEFVEGDPAALRCRVARALSVAAEMAAGTILDIEISNPGSVSAEPLAFAVRLHRRDETLVVRRVVDPLYGRAGRAIAPRGKRRYRIVVPVIRDAARRARVSVTAASFFRGQMIDEPPVRVISRHVDNDRTTVRLENRLDRRVDAVFLATYRKPVAGKTLVSRRLAPGETADWEISMFAGGANRYVGADITKLKLVDWSVVRDEGREAAAKLLQDAYARWYRWPADAPPLTGRVVYVKNSTRAEGSFVVRDGRVEIRDAGEAARDELEALFRFARRPAAATDPTLFLARRGTRVGADGEGVDLGPHRASLVEVAKGRIAATWAHPETGREAWETRDIDGGYLLTGTDHSHAGQVHTRRFEYARVARLWVPVRFVDSLRWPGIGRRSDTRLELHDVRVHRGGEAKLDDGPAARVVRAAWDSVYRHPAVVRTGKVKVRYPTAHAEWRGVRKVEATFRIAAGHVHTDFGTALKLEVREHLGFLVDGRYSMWRGVDFAARRPFREVFVGATFTGDGPAYDVKDAPFTRVEITDGRVHVLTLADGRRRVYTWKKVAGQWVVVKARTGDEEFRVRHRKLKSGYIAPVRIEIENRFGPKWGIEVLELAYD